MPPTRSSNHRKVAAKRATNVFLNVPFDDEYKPLYVALISALTAFGSTPRTVLELPPQTARLERLRTLIAECGASVHDLSRVTTWGKPPVPRFNMPFELGLTLGIHQDNHKWVVFESVSYRVGRSITDLGGYDASIHDGDPEGVLRVVANAFGAKKRVRHDDLVALWKALRKAARRVQRDRGSLFTHAAFADLVLTGQSNALPLRE